MHAAVVKTKGDTLEVAVASPRWKYIGLYQLMNQNCWIADDELLLLLLLLLLQLMMKCS